MLAAMRRLTANTFLALTLWLVGWAAGCSSAQQLDDLPRSDGGRVLVPIGELVQVTVTPPKGSRVVDFQTWINPLGQDRVLLYRVWRGPTPEGGAQAAVDRALADIGREGQAGVERDDRVYLDDLEARLVRVTDLKGQPPTSLWMILAEAEDGLYTASVLGQLDDVRKAEKENIAFLKSLRILAPVGAPRTPRPARPEDDLAPPTDATPSAR